MKKFKETVNCILLTLMFVGMFYIGILINAGTLTRLQGGLIMGSGFVAVATICFALAKE